MSPGELEAERKQVHDELNKVSGFARSCILALERLTFAASVLLLAFFGFKPEQEALVVGFTPLLLTVVLLHVVYFLFQAEAHSGYAAALEERLRELGAGRSLVRDPRDVNTQIAFM